MIKKIAIGLIGLIVILLLIGFALPGTYDLTKSVWINASSESIAEEIDNLERWPAWSYWNTLDPSMETTYGDKKSGQGASYSWKGNSKVGEGKLVITESSPTKISADLFFMQDDNPSKADYLLETSGDSTKLTISFHTEFGMNPIMRWMGLLMFPSEMNKAFDFNLAHLKELAEAKPKFSVSINEVATQVLYYIGINTTMSFENQDAVNKQMEKSFDELYSVCGKAKVDITGPPFCLYTRWDEQKKEMDMICAVPVSADAKLPANYPIRKNEAGFAIKATHHGSYNTMQTTHEDLARYVQYKKLQEQGPVMEVYLTDPTQEPDTSKWITEIYYPIVKK